MKTAISIPDPIFQAAEALAKQLGISRSELFSKAVESFIEAHKQDGVQEALDAVYGEENSEVDRAMAEMQRASLAKDAW